MSYKTYTIVMFRKEDDFLRGMDIFHLLPSYADAFAVAQQISLSKPSSVQSILNAQDKIKNAVLAGEEVELNIYDDDKIDELVDHDMREGSISYTPKPKHLS